MEVSEIREKDLWENFLLDCEEKTFLISWNWGEFQKKTGNKIWRLGIYENDDLISVALMVKVAARRGNFLFCPHGPATKKQRTGNRKQILGLLIDMLKKVAMEENASFIRISPIWQKAEENTKIFKDLGFREAPIHMHPELTWELDITQGEEKLLLDMRKTTRYLVRQAQKNPDVKIVLSQKIEDVEKFNTLYQKTVDRHHFVPFSLEYLKNEVSSFLPDNQAIIFLGYYKEELIASAIIIFWQEMAFYHQGASSQKHPKVPVSYLLQWEAIREAMKRGCRVYNFWGIAPTDSSNPPKFCFTKFRRAKHPWAGLSLFKKGFGGYKEELVKTQDFPLSPKYLINYIIEFLRRRKRNL